jgi:hypothetical protein
MNTTPFLSVFKYNTPILLSNFYQGKQPILKIIYDVSQRININHLTNLPLHPGVIELYNVRYTEKWVKRIDENLLEYHRGSRPSLNIPPHPLPQNLSYLSTKFFSGDVSGMIAESLFVYLLHHFQVNINLVGHLRPYKRGKAAFLPDFAVWDRSLVTTPLISQSNCQVPIYAEVKGSTRGVNEEQFEKALHQLSYVIPQTPQACGPVFVAYKNPNYEGIVFEVRP